MCANIHQSCSNLEMTEEAAECSDIWSRSPNKVLGRHAPLHRVPSGRSRESSSKVVIANQTLRATVNGPSSCLRQNVENAVSWLETACLQNMDSLPTVLLNREKGTA